MRILVCLKAVPGFVLGARIAEDAHAIEYQSSSVIINDQTSMRWKRHSLSEASMADESLRSPWAQLMAMMF